MEKFIHDNANGLDYELVGDYYLPLLTPPKTPQIGRFGEAYRTLRTIFSNLPKSRKSYPQIMQTSWN